MEYPCEYPVKVMGKNNMEFRSIVPKILDKHVEGFLNDKNKMSVPERLSKDGKFVSLTFTITATSRKQLDALYVDLKDCELVKFAL